MSNFAKSPTSPIQSGGITSREAGDSAVVSFWTIYICSLGQVPLPQVTLDSKHALLHAVNPCYIVHVASAAVKGGASCPCSRRELGARGRLPSCKIEHFNVVHDNNIARTSLQNCGTESSR